jgi:hypothetical protein
MAEREGKMIRLEIIIAPINLIPITTVKAVKTAISELKTELFIPVALEKFSSKVTLKIEL